MNPENVQKLVQMLKNHEGFKSQMYLCPAGFNTIGYGHNCDANGDIEKYRNLTLSETKAENILLNDLNNVLLDCAKNFKFFTNLTDPQQAVLIDMTFNIGIAGILKFKRMIINFKAGFKKSIAQEMINSKWCSQVGKRATELVYMILTDEFLGEQK